MGGPLTIFDIGFKFFLINSERPTCWPSCSECFRILGNLFLPYRNVVNESNKYLKVFDKLCICVFIEARMTDEGLCRLGWSTSHARLELGTCAQGFGFGGTGKKSHNRQFDIYGESFGLGDVIGCCLDLDDGEVSCCKSRKHFTACLHD